MSNGDLILNTFGTRPISQFAASSCRTRPTLLVRLTDVDVNRNLTQTASTLNRLRSSVPHPLKLYGLRSYESYTNPVYLYLYPLRGYVTELLLVNSLFTSLPSASTYAKMLLRSCKKIYISKKFHQKAPNHNNILVIFAGIALKFVKVGPAFSSFKFESTSIVVKEDRKQCQCLP